MALGGTEGLTPWTRLEGGSTDLQRPLAQIGRDADDAHVESVPELMALQCGVISRRQLLARDVNDAGIARMVRRRDLTRVHDGVYVEHTGDLTWFQRAWAAVLFCWPAALSHDSALRAVDSSARPDEGPIHVLVNPARRLVAPDGIRLHRGVGFARHVQWNTSPPRTRYEESVIDVASAFGDELAVIGALTRAIQSRRTTAPRLLTALDTRTRISHRAFIGGVLCDVAEGACSVLEHGYLHHIERAHGFPRAQRQVMGYGRVGRIYRDASYAGCEIELDGRLSHDSAEGRDRDYDRDLVTLVGGSITARLSYGQVFDRPCWTAGQVGRLLHECGWQGHLHRCGHACRLECGLLPGLPGVLRAPGA